MLLVVLIMLALWMSHLFLYCHKKISKKEIKTTPLNYKGKGIPLKRTLSKDKLFIWVYDIQADESYAFCNYLFNPGR
ncbi:hypothetical protein CMV_020894 [Castanea mollissima]|uniref:Uncharacterized protein n=1 Tax=Castanea mollissima TaxID=60419 RepID=A0A8J4R013_9ROSI|nr:hypothetical protein CMV_020894 [Castanea mollissima]